MGQTIPAVRELLGTGLSRSTSPSTESTPVGAPSNVTAGVSAAVIDSARNSANTDSMARKLANDWDKKIEDGNQSNEATPPPAAPNRVDTSFWSQRYQQAVQALPRNPPVTTSGESELLSSAAVDSAALAARVEVLANSTETAFESQSSGTGLYSSLIQPSLSVASRRRLVILQQETIDLLEHPPIGFVLTDLGSGTTLGSRESNERIAAPMSISKQLSTAELALLQTPLSPIERRNQKPVRGASALPQINLAPSRSVPLAQSTLPGAVLPQSIDILWELQLPLPSLLRTVYSRQTLTFRIGFPSDYPMSPPVMWMHKPARCWHPLIPCDMDNDFVEIARRRSASRRHTGDSETPDSMEAADPEATNDEPSNVLSFLVPRTWSTAVPPWSPDCATRDAVEQFIERFKIPSSKHLHAGVNNPEALRQFENDSVFHRKAFVKTARQVAGLGPLDDPVVEECASTMGESRMSEEDISTKYAAIANELNLKTQQELGTAKWFDRRIKCVNKVTRETSAVWITPVSSLDSVLFIKSRLAAVCNVPLASMDFYYDGRLLENYSSLQDCDISPESTVDWIHRARITGRSVLAFRQGRFLSYALEQYLPRVILDLIQQYA